MRIGFLLQDTGVIYGAQRATLDLIQLLRSAGEDVRVLLISETRRHDLPADYRDALAKRVPTHPLPVNRAFSPALARAIAQKVEEHKIEVLHSVGEKADTHAALAIRKKKFPLVCTIHGWLFLDTLRDSFYRWTHLLALRSFDRAIVLSRWYEEYLRTRIGSRTRLIPSGFDPNALPDIPFPDGPFTFAHAARFTAEKNHSLLIQAVQSAHEAGADFRILMAGDGPLRTEIQREIQDAGLEKTIELPGLLSREAFLTRAHALVQCSRIENLPYSVMEAMAARRPVLATKVGGIPDLVEDGRTGFLVPPDDVSALAQAMQDIAKAPDLAAQMGIAGRKKLEQEFSPAQMLQAHLQLYRELI